VHTANVQQTSHPAHRLLLWYAIRSVAARYSALRSLRYVAARYGRLRYGALGRVTARCDTLLCVTDRYDKLRCTTVLRYGVALRYVTAPCGALRIVTVRCGSLRHLAVRYGTLMCVTDTCVTLRCVTEPRHTKSVLAILVLKLVAMATSLRHPSPVDHPSFPEFQSDLRQCLSRDPVIMTDKVQLY